MILDITYFQGELHLPHLKTKTSAVGVGSRIQIASEDSLDWYIEKYEEEFLKKLLGSSLATEFIKNKDSEEEIWKELRSALYKEGIEFSFSPSANYVYYYARLANRTQTAQQGETIGTQSYSMTAMDIDKLVGAWNGMCDMIEEFRCGFLKNNWDKYKELVDCIPCYRWAERINKFGI